MRNKGASEKVDSSLIDHSSLCSSEKFFGRLGADKLRSNGAEVASMVSYSLQQLMHFTVKILVTKMRVKASNLKTGSTSLLISKLSENRCAKKKRRSMNQIHRKIETSIRQIFFIYYRSPPFCDTWRWLRFKQLSRTKNVNFFFSRLKDIYDVNFSLLTL